MIAIQSSGPFSGGPSAYLESTDQIEPWIREQWADSLTGIEYHSGLIVANISRNGGTFTHCYRTYPVTAWRPK